MQTMWSMILENSDRTTRTAFARAGISIPSICSTARA